MKCRANDQFIASLNSFFTLFKIQKADSVNIYLPLVIWQNVKVIEAGGQTFQSPALHFQNSVRKLSRPCRQTPAVSIRSRYPHKGYLPLARRAYILQQKQAGLAVSSDNDGLF